MALQCELLVYSSKYKSEPNKTNSFCTCKTFEKAQQKYLQNSIYKNPPKLRVYMWSLLYADFFKCDFACMQLKLWNFRGTYYHYSFYVNQFLMFLSIAYNEGQLYLVFLLFSKTHEYCQHYYLVIE